MRDLTPQIPLQLILSEQLQIILQCDALLDIRKALHSSSMDFQERSNIVANGMKVTPSTMPDLYHICYSIKEELGIKDDVDFYITGDNTVNASSYLSEEEDEAHIVTINSGLFNLMNENELKFIIGHELGHLINKDSVIYRQLAFVYPDDDADYPCYLANRMNQYGQLAEYGADRYGYLACMDLGACISAFYKLSSGIDLQHVGVGIEALLEENEHNMEYIFENGVVYGGSHPGNPCRVYALQMFAQCKTQKKLDEEMAKLYDLLPGMKMRNSQYYITEVAVHAACQMAGGKNKLSRVEMEKLLELVGENFIFPSKTIKDILKKDEEQTISEGISVVMDEEPALLDILLKFLLEVAMADGVITKEEINFIVTFGITRLKMEMEDVFRIIGNEVVSHYNCSATGI